MKPANERPVKCSFMDRADAPVFWRRCEIDVTEECPDLEEGFKLWLEQFPKTTIRIYPGNEYLCVTHKLVMEDIGVLKVESTHVIVESVHEGTIEPDDAIRILMPHYAPNIDGANTVESIEQYMADELDETGKYPEEFIDFRLCDGCRRLLLWDDETEDYRHLVLTECPVNAFA